MVKDIKETAKEIYSDINKIPLFAIFIILITFHITLLSDDYSQAMERIFAFYYTPENENVFNFARHFLSNIAFAGFIYRCWLIIEKERLFYRISYLSIYLIKDEELQKKGQEAEDKAIKNFVNKRINIEGFIILAILARYFLDILKYYKKSGEEYFEIFINENIKYLLLGIISVFIAFVIAFVVERFYVNK